MTNLTDINTVPLLVVLLLVVGLGLAAAGRVLGDARRDRADAQDAEARAQLDKAIARHPAGQALPARIIHGHAGSTFRFQCVSCLQVREVPLESVIGDGLWRPTRCTECAPTQQRGRAS